MTAVEVGDPVTADLLDLMLNPPICRLLAQSTQSLTDNTPTGITFGAGSEDIDTNGFHDTTTNNTRITPNVAGYYLVTGVLWLGSATTLLQLYSAIYKNGTGYGINRVKPLATTTAQSAHVTAVVPVNGSTDFIELFGLQDDSGGTARSTVTGAGTSSWLEAVFLRPL